MYDVTFCIDLMQVKVEGLSLITVSDRISLNDICGSSDSEEEMDTTPAPAATKAKKAGMVKAKEESEEEDDEDDDDDDDDEEEEDGEFEKDIQACQIFKYCISFIDEIQTGPFNLRLCNTPIYRNPSDSGEEEGGEQEGHTSSQEGKVRRRR